MDETTSRHRAPLIPTISTLDHDESSETAVPAPGQGRTICIVVVTIIEIDPQPRETA